jgi:dTDP-glucose pyrophosphorylase
MHLVDCEKPNQGATSPWYNAGLYVSPKHFRFPRKMKPSPRGEYELIDAIRDLAQSGKSEGAQLTGEWADVRDPEILARLNQKL